MGEQADLIISGECCALCGTFFGFEHGYPVACSDCYSSGCGYLEAEQ